MIRFIVLLHVILLIESYVVPQLPLFRGIRNRIRPLFMGEGDTSRKRDLRASEREKRSEEKRRQERKDDVVIGKTSARKGATDYVLDAKATEEQYLQQASGVEREIFYLTEEGLQHINLVRADCICE